MTFSTTLVLPSERVGVSVRHYECDTVEVMRTTGRYETVDSTGETGHLAMLLPFSKRNPGPLQRWYQICILPRQSLL